MEKKDSKRSKNKERVLVCVICGRDFDRTIQALYTAVEQDHPDYEVFVVGNREDIGSFEKIFEILNYAKVRSDVDFKCPYRRTELDFLEIALREARRKGFDRLCVLPEGASFPEKTSLSRILNGKNPESRSAYRILRKSVARLLRKGEGGGCGWSCGPMVFKNNPFPVSNEIDGHYEEKISERTPIRMVLFVHSYALWASMQTFYEACQKNKDVDVKIVHVRQYHLYPGDIDTSGEISDFTKNGYKVIASDDYDLASDRPDIAVFGRPYSTVEKGYTIDEVIKIVPRCVYIHYGYMLNTGWQELIRLRYKIAMIYLAWIVFYGDKDELEQGKKYVFGNGSNLAAVGLPRMDITRNLTKNSYPEYAKDIFRRAKGRKIVLWNTHHSINTSDRSFSSWKSIGTRLVEHIKNDHGVFFLWRPHPLFQEELCKFMGEEESKIFFFGVEKCENIYIDKESTYFPAFSVSDLMLSDASSLAKEYLYTGKPVVVTVTEKNIIENIHPYDCLEICDTYESAVSAVDRIIHGTDEKKRSREEYIQSLKIDEKSVGEKMLDYILERYRTDR